LTMTVLTAVGRKRSGGRLEYGSMALAATAGDPKADHGSDRRRRRRRNGDVQGSA
jgi:hypothetical protein